MQIMSEMKWQDAIIKVLEESEEPLHYAEIAEQIVERGLRENVGATPARTVAYYLSTSLTNEGDASPFERVARGEYRPREVRSVSAEGGQPRPTAPFASEESEDVEEYGPINAFGMYWRRKDVSWTGSSIKLLGQQYKGSDDVDFGEQRGIYLLHDGREVIYVGRTTSQRLGFRLKEHTKDRLEGRWDRFSWFGINVVDSDGSLVENEDRIEVPIESLIVAMESLLIEGLEPRQNRRRGDGFVAVEYLQVVDPDVLKKEQELLLEKMKSAL